MDTKDIRKKSPADLTKVLAQEEAELRAFRFGMSGSRTKNVRSARVLKRTIARIKTIMSETK